MPYAKKDIVSTTKEKTVYAKKGDPLRIIHESFDVLIVENSKGERFSVKKEDLV